MTARGFGMLGVPARRTKHSATRNLMRRHALVPLTVSGNEITDAVRSADVQGDGLTPPSGYGIWEAATNLIKNGGAETAVSGWQASGNVTVTRDATQQKFGVASVKCVCTNTTTASVQIVDPVSGLITGLTGAAKYTFSVWLQVTSGSAVSVFLSFIEFDAGNVQLVQTDSAALSVSSSWQRFSITVTTNALTVKGEMAVTFATPTLGLTAYLDGAQVELNQIATPYVETNGATATRGAARVRMPATLLDETQMWAAFRVQYGYASTALPASNRFIFDWRDDANNFLILDFLVATRKWNASRKATTVDTAQTAAQTFALGDKTTVVATWTATQVAVSIAGGAFTTAASTHIPTLAATLSDLGSQAGTVQLDGNILWAAFGTGTLADPDAATINGYGDTPPLTPQVFPGTGVLVWAAATAVMYA